MREDFGINKLDSIKQAMDIMKQRDCILKISNVNLRILDNKEFRFYFEVPLSKKEYEVLNRHCVSEKWRNWEDRNNVQVNRGYDYYLDFEREEQSEYLRFEIGVLAEHYKEFYGWVVKRDGKDYVVGLKECDGYVAYKEALWERDYVFGEYTEMGRLYGDFSNMSWESIKSLGIIENSNIKILTDLFSQHNDIILLNLSVMLLDNNEFNVCYQRQIDIGSSEFENVALKGKIIKEGGGLYCIKLIKQDCYDEWIKEMSLKDSIPKYEMEQPDAYLASRYYSLTVNNKKSNKKKSNKQRRLIKWITN